MPPCCWAGVLLISIAVFIAASRLKQSPRSDVQLRPTYQVRPGRFLRMGSPWVTLTGGIMATAAWRSAESPARTGGAAWASWSQRRRDHSRQFRGGDAQLAVVLFWSLTKGALTHGRALLLLRGRPGDGQSWCRLHPPFTAGDAWRPSSRRRARLPVPGCASTNTGCFPKAVATAPLEVGFKGLDPVRCRYQTSWASRRTSWQVGTRRHCCSSRGDLLLVAKPSGKARSA